ncbi:MAG: serpin family protein, partial [Clostridiaceae bacterium]|nr:serpin family protein [Clostridiaceae bacterium]
MRKLKLHRTTKIVLAIILVILAVPFSACKITGPQGRTDSTEPDGPNATTKKPTLNVTPIPDGQIVNLMATLKAKPDVKAAETDAARAAILNDFSVRLIRAQLAEREKEQKNKSNFLLSPYVMQSVLTMVANGAAGDTLSEMLAVLAGKSGEGGESDKVTGDAGSDADKVGKAADATLRALNELMLGTRRDSEREAQQLFINGSIWYRTGASYFRINPDFLQTNADYFGIPAFGAPFDNATVKAMNDLIAEQTKGLI